MGQIKRMQDFSEIIPYNRYGIPMYIGVGHLDSHFERNRLIHWHEEVEFTRIIGGSMVFRVREQKIQLQTGDVLFTNSRQMHGNRLEGEGSVDYQCLLFHTDLLTGSRMLHQQWIEPVTDNKNVPYLYIPQGAPGNAALTEPLEAIFATWEQGGENAVLEVIGHLHILWDRLRPLCTGVQHSTRDYNDETLQKDMVSYIYQHYAERLTLADIAAAGHVCQNKCCSIFRRYMQQSPVDFLNSYRLQVSRNMLENTEMSITEIAMACGFNHLSYFSKMFQRKYGITPRVCRGRQE